MREWLGVLLLTLGGRGADPRARPAGPAHRPLHLRHRRSGPRARRIGRRGQPLHPGPRPALRALGRERERHHHLVSPQLDQQQHQQHPLQLVERRRDLQVRGCHPRRDLDLGRPDLRRAGADAWPRPLLRGPRAERAPLQDAPRHPARRRAVHLYPPERRFSRLRPDLRRRLQHLRRAHLRERDDRLPAEPRRVGGRDRAAPHLRRHQPHRLRRGAPVRQHRAARDQHGHHHSLRQQRAAAALLLRHAREPCLHRQPLLRGLLLRPRRRLGPGEGQPPRGHAGLARDPRARAASRPAAKTTCAAPARCRSAGWASRRRGSATSPPT